MTLFPPIFHVTQLRTIDHVFSLSSKEMPLKLCVYYFVKADDVHRLSVLDLERRLGKVEGP